MERTEDWAALYAAIGQLPPVRARRVCAYSIPGISRISGPGIALPFRTMASSLRDNKIPRQSSAPRL
ncbi:hypothetical protein [Pseudoflavonifractor sp. 524-17]|uniref:hypothetical protein n=1 Tax=Pseudoflavonifractor sp. 524-17 TaxID=2304577 RepID=UPI00192A49BD|nr:hypothetical protein [Pseudoflavonifractor sp. 524-17]